MKRRRASAAAGTNRRWHIPPPLIHGPEPLEGGAVLAEIPGPTGFALWLALRDVLLWAETPAAERAGLFAPGAARERSRLLGVISLDAVLEVALPVLSSLLDDSRRSDEKAVAMACGEIVRWAEEQGATSTALAFAQNAALTDAGEAAPALSVARLAVRLGDHARAEVWFRRSIGIARRARDWRLYARAFSGLGSLYQSRGNLPAAHRIHLRALRGARRGGLRVERAVALHDLFGVSVEAGRAPDAERYAREALAAYPPSDPRVAVLAHDVAYFWMEQGHFSRALDVFRAVAPLIERPAERLWVEADLMRAAAGAGDAALAKKTAQRVRELCSRPELATAAARAHLELARGELHLDHLDAAETAATAALELATEHREGRIGLTAEALLDSIRTARAANGRPATEAWAASKRSGAAGESLAEDIIRTLRELSYPASSERNAQRDTLPYVNGSKRPEAHAH